MKLGLLADLQRGRAERGPVSRRLRAGPETSIVFRYFRGERGFGHRNGRPYRVGEVIADRPMDVENPAPIAGEVGIVETRIDPGQLN